MNRTGSTFSEQVTVTFKLGIAGVDESDIRPMAKAAGRGKAFVEFYNDLRLFLFDNDLVIAIPLPAPADVVVSDEVVRRDDFSPEFEQVTYTAQFTYTLESI